MILHDQIMDELRHIPDDKLAEVYDFVHYFRLGLGHEAESLPGQRPIGMAKGLLQIPPGFFDPLPDELLDAFEGK
jgi:hypothetical protein